ncbi:MAG: restriction endonuclease subunit S [Polyangiaceae bacterium]|nr:restriction endonuclease subunit S [Polyangiaceae bacterium]
MAEPLLDCPRSWRRATLEPDARRGLIARVDSGATPSTRDPAYWDGGILWLTPKEVARADAGLFVTRTERTLSAAGLRACGARVVPPATVLLTKRAPVGVVAVAGAPMATNQGFLNFTCGPELRPLYLAYWLLGNRRYLELVANGSTYPELYKADLFEFEIAVPDLSTQDRATELLGALEYVARLGPCLERTTTHPAHMQQIQNQTRRIERLRDAMLPAILSGRLDVCAARRRAPSPPRTSQDSCEERVVAVRGAPDASPMDNRVDGGVGRRAPGAGELPRDRRMRSGAAMRVRQRP